MCLYCMAAARPLLVHVSDSKAARCGLRVEGLGFGVEGLGLGFRDV